jgi:branched-chain amino acid transport system substrate-binding protein
MAWSKRLTRGAVSAVVGMAALTASGLSGGPALAQDPIKIGEINSYTALPAFTEPYRMGWQLALEEINAAGGVKGRPLEVISKDDAGKPGDAVTAANELTQREDVVLLMGTFFSHIGLAVADYAKQREVLFVAAEPLTDALVWAKGNDYTFRLRPNVTMQAEMLAEEAAKLDATRWATVAPNYEYGTSAVEAFKAAMERRRDDIEWVNEQWPPFGKIDAGSTVQAVAQSDPQAIFNVTFGPDLTKFVREGTTRGLFKDRQVVSLLTGEPEYMDPLGAETPEGWIVTGYPWDQIDTPEHNAFLKAYQDKFDDYPRLGSIVGYATMKSVGAILEKAESFDTEDLIAAGKGIEIDSPFGPITYRPFDHQSTLGAYVGRTAVENGAGKMVDFSYRDGADYLPSEEQVKELRPDS